MSYPLDLDEISTKALVNELARRERLLKEGRCPYCCSPLKSQPPCKMTSMHNQESLSN